MNWDSLERKLRAAATPVQMMRHAPLGAYVSKVPPEFTNWRDEQRAWREDVALLTLTHHMTDLTLHGRDAIRLLSDLAINSFANFRVNTAKQFVCCNPDGDVIGDGILFYLGEDHISLLGLPPAHNWVQYHARDYRISVERDDATLVNPTGRRKLYRYQVQGPRAFDVLEKASGACVPELKFFNIGELTIAGRRVRALRHGMVGAPGLELFGPSEDDEVVHGALLEAGMTFGMRKVGSLAYPTSTLESGWLPAPVPAIYAHEELKGYREQLPGDGYEAAGSLSGSFYSEEVQDYYLNPYELGYGPFVKFDHGFVGRTALETLAKGANRHKVTLVWNGDDVAAAMRTLFEPGIAAKYIPLPWSGYGTFHYDRVVVGERLAGLSTRCGYSYNERAMLSLAVVDPDVTIGTEVRIIWGEEGGGSRKPVVERHRQVEIRAVVAPCPYSTVARTTYAPAGWRARAQELRE